MAPAAAWELPLTVCCVLTLLLGPSSLAFNSDVVDHLHALTPREASLVLQSLGITESLSLVAEKAMQRENSTSADGNCPSSPEGGDGGGGKDEACPPEPGVAAAGGPEEGDSGPLLGPRAWGPWPI